MSVPIRVCLYVLCLGLSAVFGYRLYVEYEGVSKKPASATTTDLDIKLPEESGGGKRKGAQANLGTWGAALFFTLAGLGLLAGQDISKYFSGRATKLLFNDDGDPITDPEYEIAENEWAKGNHLDAIRLLREYLAKNPREQFAALRIAEIYEKDLNNPLAAALEYEEVLTKKLPPERWGWAAIHLCNLYSTKLGQMDKAVALLRRLDEEYPETAAAGKARQRLAMYDQGELGPEPREGGA
ncbi:MAG: tetratricopeptide repeat protein [Verrucomicrobia bacterium]|nr:tetratricopeptide repeat protein [Verrucomicrobiota bacterium]